MCDGEQPAWISQKAQRGLRACVSLLGKLFEPRFAHRDQSHFRRRKKRVGPENQQKKKNAKTVMRLVHTATKIPARIALLSVQFLQCA